MSEAITLALITGGVTLVTSLVSSILVFIINNKKLRAEQEKTQADQIAAQNAKIDKMQADILKELSDHKEEYMNEINNIHNSITEIKMEAKNDRALTTQEIKTLSERVEKHNNIIERTYKLETDVAVLKEKVGSV